MKITTLAAAAALAFTTTAQAGGLADPIDVIEPMEDMVAPSSSANIIVPLIILGLIGLAASADND